MNLLIVDDQPNVLSSLVQSINWSSIGINNVYSASSVLLAKKVITENNVDILLTDIEMPIENGLSLVEWIRDTNRHISCIIISAHADFQYAQQAISLKVTDYLVQPARNEDIQRAVSKAIEQLEQERNRQDTLNQISFSVEEQNHAARRFFEKWPKPTDPDFAQKLSKNLQRIRDLNLDCEDNDTIYAILLRIDTWHTLPSDTGEFLVGYMKLLKNTLSYINAYSLQYSVSDSLYTTIVGLHTNGNDFCEYLDVLKQQIFSELQCSVSFIYSSTDFAHLGITLSEMLQDESLQKAMSPSVIAEFEKQSYAKKTPVLTTTQYFNQIEEYINNHIEEPITRSEIADHTHISPDYVSRIVREQCGLSSKELITEKKMAYAKMLLETTGMSVGEVASKCGFDSFAYFSKVYKQVNKVSPKETRK